MENLKPTTSEVQDVRPSESSHVNDEAEPAVTLRTIVLVIVSPRLPQQTPIGSGC